MSNPFGIVAACIFLFTKAVAMNHNTPLMVHSLLLSICPQDLLDDSEWKFVFFALSLILGYTLLVSLSGFPNTEYRFHSPRGLQTSLHQLSGSLLSDVQD